MTATGEAHEGKRELAYRETNGTEVSLLWDPGDDSLIVAVIDWKTGDAFDVAAARENALQVFRHPYVYAARRPDLGGRVYIR